MSATDVGLARAVIERHADLGISLADASIVVLAQRHGLVDVLTLDQRHFRVLDNHGKPFRVLPADE
jgi:predicted nucleic acid-binding protein